MFNWGKKTKKRVGCESSDPSRIRQQEADRRPVRSAWAPALSVDSVTDFHDLMGERECKDDLRERVERLETLLENVRATASEEKMWNEMSEEKMRS